MIELNIALYQTPWQQTGAGGRAGSDTPIENRWYQRLILHGTHPDDWWKGRWRLNTRYTELKP